MANLLKDSEATLRAVFDEFEGKGFYDYSMKHSEGETLGAAVRTIKSDWKQPQCSLGLIIYGSGGFHRYFVGKDGEVIADPYYGIDARKAAAAGFKIRGR